MSYIIRGGRSSFGEGLPKNLFRSPSLIISPLLLQGYPPLCGSPNWAVVITSSVSKPAGSNQQPGNIPTYVLPGVYQHRRE
jgi:hypothetical protein